MLYMDSKIKIKRKMMSFEMMLIAFIIANQKFARMRDFKRVVVIYNIKTFFRDKTNKFLYYLRIINNNILQFWLEI